MATGKLWTRAELQIALNLYHKFLFSQIDARQPAIVEVAQKMGRSPNSLAMKLLNLASLDPDIRSRGRVGLQGVSSLDRTMWDEYHQHSADKVADAEIILRKLFSVKDTDQIEIIPRVGVRIVAPVILPTERKALTKVRVNQSVFRQMVLSNFDGRCGITGLSVRELLIASHILPWSKHESERLNRRNGICLSRLHDAAFDSGLIGFDSNYRLQLSPRLRDQVSQRSVKENFAAYEGEMLRFTAETVRPDERFLGTHYATVFKR